MINKLSDIEMGREYHLLESPDKRRVRKAVVHGIINEEEEFPATGRTEVYLTIYRRGRFASRNLVQASWIGLGETTDEAYRNLGRFRFEANDNFDRSLKAVKERMVAHER